MNIKNLENHTFPKYLVVFRNYISNYIRLTKSF
ncbi:uncharacterized protein METZ01_LOCUS122681, partial [marine metagenome]